MRGWFKIAAPLGICAVLVTVLAIGVRSPGSNAAECNVGAKDSGRLASGSSTAYTATFCSDPTAQFAVYVQWRWDPAKDLALRVTSPTGEQFFVDTHGSSLEVFAYSAPLPEGDWTVEVINVGSRGVNYDLQMGFG